MAIPNRPAQIRAVAEFLNDPRNEDRTVEEVATRIVDGIYDLWSTDETTPPVPLDVGLAFKVPWSSKVHHVAWRGQFWTLAHGLMDHVWVVSADSEYGSLTPVYAPQWRVIQSSKAKAGAPGNNPLWAPGDHARPRSTSEVYEILATGDKCVLMRDTRNHDNIFANSNESLARLYEKVTKR